MQPIPTQKDLLDVYLGLVVAQDTSADVSQYTDYYNKGNSLAGMGAGLAQDSYQLYSKIYAQYSDAQGINLQLANEGVPIQTPASPAIISLHGNDLVAGKTYNVPLGTTLTASNGSTYSVISSVNSNDSFVIITTVTNILYIVSVVAGANHGQNIGTILPISPPIVSTDGASTLSNFTADSSSDGSDQENIAHATTRLITIKQTPLCGTRTTDFYNLVSPNIANNVNDAKVLNKNKLTYTNPYWNVGVYIISQPAINDFILNKGLLPGTTAVVYTRTSSQNSINNATNTINAQDIINTFPIVNTVSTQQLTVLDGVTNVYFKIVVTLQKGFSLGSLVTLSDGVFNIYQLIQREVRRAICIQPFGATLVLNPISGKITSSSFPVSSMEQQLDTTLGTPNTPGTLGTFLLDRQILVWNGTAYVYQPTLPLSVGLPIADTDTLQWVYDVSLVPDDIYTNILVVAS